MHKNRKTALIAYLVAILLNAVGTSAMAVPSPAADDADPKRHFLYRLAEQLHDKDPLQRYDFASISLAELTDAYRRSHAQSFKEKHSKIERQRKLARWRNGLERYIDQLQQIRSQLTFDSRIEVVTTPRGPINLFINQMPVVLSGPEISQARHLEQQIVDRFCSLHDCSAFDRNPVHADAQVRPKPAPVGAGRWRLQYRQGARYETPDGLVFVFRSLSGRQQKQRRCELIARDMRLLVSELLTAQRAGYPIDWTTLRIQSLYEGPTEHININRQGDYLRLDLSFFDSQRQPDQQLLKWVRRRVENREAFAIIVNAEKLVTGD